MRKLLVLGILAAAMALSLSACTKQAENTAEQPKDGSAASAAKALSGQGAALEQQTGEATPAPSPATTDAGTGAGTATAPSQGAPQQTH